MRSYSGSLIYGTGILREGGGKVKKTHFIHCYWTWDVQVWLCKICVWVAVCPFLQSILCSLSGRVTLCETNKDRAASPSTTLWRLTPATPRHYRSSVQAFSVLLGDTLKSKLKVSNSLFVVNCLNISHARTLQYSWVLWFFLFFKIAM